MLLDYPWSVTTDGEFLQYWGTFWGRNLLHTFLGEVDSPIHIVSYRSSPLGISRALEYAKNMGNGSTGRAILSVRARLGKKQVLHQEDHHRTSPDFGYDSVSRTPNFALSFR